MTSSINRQVRTPIENTAKFGLESRQTAGILLDITLPVNEGALSDQDVLPKRPALTVPVSV